MRNALERLGHAPPARSNPRPAPDSAGKRRRFVRDGEVPVEKHTLARVAAPRTVSSPRTGAAARSVHFSDEDNGELSRLRRHVAEEKLRAEEAERQMAGLRNTQSDLMTRISLADAQVLQLKGQLAERENQLAQMEQKLHTVTDALRTQENEVQKLEARLEAQETPRPRKPAKSYVLAQEEAGKNEPAPVKWWKD